LHIIKALGEKHTFFMTPDQAKAQATGKASNNTEPPPLLLPEGAELEEGIGVIRLYGFSGSTEQGKQYAEFGQGKLKGLQARGICKFVVDLRPNVGGNMYPMIDAVSGLLDEGVLGTFENAAGQVTPWVLRDGKTTIVMAGAAAPEPSTQVRGSVPVAVLIGPSTSSAGEYTAMSFRGRANTRFFGAPTSGYITANQPVPLSDGAVIIMTTAWGSDRTGRKYVDRMEPDEVTGAGGPALDAAIDWLSRQRCASRTKAKKGR
jgi:C-terminal processing protease CtpA/Prc